MANSYDDIASRYNRLEAFPKALEYYMEALAIREKIFSADHPYLAATYHNLALTYGYLKDDQRKKEFNLKALAIREKILPTLTDLDLATAYLNLASTYGSLGDYQKQLNSTLKRWPSMRKYLQVIPCTWNGAMTIWPQRIATWATTRNR
ncbi:MAG: tetratricopeptide repeat protein [Haliscomenobacter sp.]|nr:tetratricopeptide repeat protein [Haliscomenobacter sp.]MBK9492085.1 tetratricopeptide repeat protein [Haliscomenobacter sp.]